MEWFFLAFSSALLSATASISEKKVLFNTEALDFSFVLALFNMVLSAVFFFFVDFSNVTIVSLIVLYGKTIMGALAFLCVMLAIKNMEISGALPLLVVTPGIVAFLSFILLGEVLSALEIGGMFLLLSGTYILESGKSNDFLAPLKVFMKSRYHHYVIFALLLFTATSLLDKYLLRDYSMHPYAFMGFQQFFLAINFTIILFFYKRPHLQVIKSLPKESLLWILVISIMTIGYRYTQIEAVKLAPVALILSVKRISVFFATIIGGKLFREHYLLKKVLATIILIAGALLIINSDHL